LNHITISLDGLSQINNQIRGDAAFEKAEENIDKLNYYKSEHKSFFPTVGINFTIMDRNIEDILPMVEFARAKKCNIVVFQPVLFNNIRMYEKKKNVLWPSGANIVKLQEIIKEVIKLKNSLEDIYIYTDTRVLEMLPDYFKGKKAGKDFKCYEAIKRIVITYDGILWSCVGTYGDLKKNTLKEIWFSDAAIGVRNKVKGCREHCLQDCVYFPSNILEQAKIFLKKINCLSQEEKVKVKNSLSERIDYYRASLVTKNRNPFLKPLKIVDFSCELRNLYLLRGEIERF
jgi:MoaA/NifB/PqqE/SkfB family radical SAM enzyme